MAKINTFSISSVGTDSVSYSYSYTSEAYVTKDSSKYSRLLEEKIETVSWAFSTTGGTSVTNSCSYTRGGTGTTTYNLKAVLTTNYVKKSYGWILDENSTEFEVEFTEKQEDKEGRILKTEFKYQGRDTVNNQTVYYYDIYYYDWGELESASGTSTDEKTVTFFPRPLNFTFINCTSGKQWLISEGINKSLITNLTSFQSSAQQWKSWKNQVAQDACPAFDSPISAERLNSIHAYVNSGKTYNQGDKIAAEMFNSLSTAINSV